MIKPLSVLEYVALVVLCLRCNECCFAQNDPPEQSQKVESQSKAERDKNGLYTLATPRLTLVSDIPFDDELRSWPGLIEQSIEQWKTYFSVDAGRIANWKMKAILMRNRDRFDQLGMLDGVPSFDEGYQFGDVIYVREQPTTYYRRLLFLHEATHWIIWKLYGGGGSPWFMEGMAEMHGTHALNHGVLKLGVIPASRDQVAGWGRLRLIDETLQRGDAPAMAEILAFGNEREDHEIRYSWSWAACVFFTNHPKYGPILKELYRSEKLDYSNALSLKFKKRLAPDWAEMELEWSAFVSDLDFGYDYSRSAVCLSMRPESNRWSIKAPTRLSLESERGWQPTGFLVEANKPVQISCTGNFQLKRSFETAWIVEPCGITYQYYRGNPLGCVIGSIVSEETNENTHRWETFRIAAGTLVNSPKAGKLFLKVNAPSNGLKDNSGNVSVEISVTNP